MNRLRQSAFKLYSLQGRFSGYVLFAALSISTLLSVSVLPNALWTHVIALALLSLVAIGVLLDGLIWLRRRMERSRQPG